MLTLEYKADIHVNDEYADDTPNKAIIEIDVSLAKRILQLSKIVAKQGVYSITDFDYTPKLMYEMDEEIEEWGGSADTMIIEITKDTYYWSCYIKHTNVKLETEPLSLHVLREGLKVLTTKSNMLPLLIGKLKFNPHIDLLDRRLKGAK